MKIAIDFEGTLTPEFAEFPVEPPRRLPSLIFPFSVRTEARELLQGLVKAGHTLTLYIQPPLSTSKLWLWCQLQDLPVHQVCHRTHTPESGGWIGHDLLLVNDALYVAAVRSLGRRALLVPKDRENWPLPIWEEVQTLHRNR